jgi:hypothetical protein
LRTGSFFFEGQPANLAAAMVTALNTVSTALTILSWRAPADPMEIHDVLLTAFRAKALHLGFIMIDHGLAVFRSIFFVFFSHWFI